MKKTEAQFGVGTLHQLVGAALFVLLITAWWFDHRGFLHGVAVGFQIWWLWSIRPHRTCAKEELFEAQHNVAGEPRASRRLDPLVRRLN